jgi:hypothetical protein
LQLPQNNSAFWRGARKEETAALGIDHAANEKRKTTMLIDAQCANNWKIDSRLQHNPSLFYLTALSQKRKVHWFGCKMLTTFIMVTTCKELRCSTM